MNFDTFKNDTGRCTINTRNHVMATLSVFNWYSATPLDDAPPKILL